MNEYRFKDLHIGMVETFDHIVREDDMNMFCRITSDYNPLHIEIGMGKGKFIHTLAKQNPENAV